MIFHWKISISKWNVSKTDWFSFVWIACQYFLSETKYFRQDTTTKHIQYKATCKTFRNAGKLFYSHVKRVACFQGCFRTCVSQQCLCFAKSTGRENCTVLSREPSWPNRMLVVFVFILNETRLNKLVAQRSKKILNRQKKRSKRIGSTSSSFVSFWLIAGCKFFCHILIS